MTINTRETPEQIIAVIHDVRLCDGAHVQEIGDTLIGLCKRCADNSMRMLIDFQHVSFMSSTMLDKLVLLNKEAKRHSVDLRLINLNDDLFEIFRIVRFDEVFQFDRNTPES